MVAFPAPAPIFYSRPSTILFIFITGRVLSTTSTPHFSLRNITFVIYWKDAALRILFSQRRLYSVHPITRGTFLLDTSRIVHDRNRIPVHHSSRQKGFSILEMVVVCAILMIVGAMVFVNAARLVQGIRLNQSATSYANMLQQARLRAVRDDNFYSVLTTTSAKPLAFIDLGQQGTYTAGYPAMVFSQNVTSQPFSSGPGRTNLQAQFLPANGQGAVDSSDNPTFGPRGLPCRPNGGTCPSLAQPTAYITFFQNSVTQKWAAVTITPAARIQVWNYDGSTWNLAN